MTVLHGNPSLVSLIHGPDPDRAAARIAFFAAAVGLDENAPDLDLGGSDDAAFALALVVMRHFGQLEAAEVRRRLASVRVEAASRVRASGAAPRQVRKGSGRVHELGTKVRHGGFFVLEERLVQHGRFAGGDSSTLTRELFLAGDAVTVLPYDPARDRVLLVEQFRIGPMGRGDPLPWQLEAIAGRIDPGETPEDAARREAMEEAGLAIGAMEKIAEYYPTPGAVSEYLYSYLAVCDLPDCAAGVFGAEDEGEDILGHLLSFDDLMAAVASGEVSNAPLILSALWLQRERPRLRNT